jgi:hypothetical protein
MRKRLDFGAQAQAVAAAREQATRDSVAQDARGAAEYLLEQAAACLKRNPRRASRLLRTASRLVGELV